MKCSRVEKFLPLHVAGDLTARRARTLAKHLTTCEECRRTADEYAASRRLLRAATTVPPEFDEAFYAEIRNSVLAQVKRGESTHAPLSSPVLLSFFKGRFAFAYAAALALILLAVALSLHSFLPRITGEAGEQKMIVNANSGLISTPATTAAPSSSQPLFAQLTRPDRRTSPARDEFAEETTGGGGARETKSPIARRRRARIVSARSGAQQSLLLTSYTPSQIGRDSPAPDSVRTQQATNPPALAMGNKDGGNSNSSGGDATTTTKAAVAEVSRIEIQTSDPNIRIIWLSPAAAEATAQPLK